MGNESQKRIWKIAPSQKRQAQDNKKGAVITPRPIALLLFDPYNLFPCLSYPICSSVSGSPLALSHI